MFQVFRKIPGRKASGPALIFLLCITMSVSESYAQSVVPPDDPQQSITYWRQHAISPEKDSLAAMAERVFAVLLRAWDSSRLEPSLYVVKSSAGPWAASLADGNILLSRAAIESCLKFGKHRAEHLLAFVLAHELAHQRSDDLWHQRFFRLIGNQSKEVRKIMNDEFQANRKAWEDIGQKENQADHDGLIMMASVGYDPYQIIDKKDFFTVWVENVWQASCNSAQGNQHSNNACQQARSRALRTQAQLAAVATQSTLYEMGVQAFIAGRYAKARKYFTVYGRDYTNRAILSAIGQTHFAQAIEYHKQLVTEHGWSKPVYYYPLMIDSSASVFPHKSVNVSMKRASLSAEAKKTRAKMQQHINQSIEYFEKAVRLDPKNPRTYLMLAFSYLLADNPYMVRGIIQGKYIPQFGSDKVVDYVLALSNGIEGKSEEAEQEFNKLLAQPEKLQKNRVFPNDVLLYSAFYNNVAYLEYLGKKEFSTGLWQKLAEFSRNAGRPVLFQLAVKHLNDQIFEPGKENRPPLIHGMRLGDRARKAFKRKHISQSNNIWVDGEEYKVYRLGNGGRFVVNSKNRIINAWQDEGQTRLDMGIKIGDKSSRVMKSLGTPDRQLHMISGEYLAYDQYGLAIHLIDNRITGWFLYQPI